MAPDECPSCLRIGHAIVRAGDALDGLPERLARAEWDAVELDVLAHRGRLLIAHDRDDLECPEPLAFDDALAALRDHLPTRTGLVVDLKAAGYERAVVDALRRLELTERALVSTMLPGSLRLLRELAPGLRRGLSVPRASRNYLAHPLTRPPAQALLVVVRRMLPRRAAAAIDSGLAHAIMANWTVVTPALVAAVTRADGELYAWTVQDGARMRMLDALGVTGVIADDWSVFARAIDS